MDLAIFGAKSIALGVYRAIKKLCEDNDEKSVQILCFLVSRKSENPATLAGLPVCELGSFKEKNIRILIATPENIQEEIAEILEAQGFYNYTCIDSRKVSELMGCYYAALGKFPTLHQYNPSDGYYIIDKLCHEKNDTGIIRNREYQNKEYKKTKKIKSKLPSLKIYVVKSGKDKPLKKSFAKSEWIIPIQVGTSNASARESAAIITDDEGENISAKNANYSELTALYWIWKNSLNSANNAKADFYGLFHYRRILEIRKEDMTCLSEMDIDAILPFPTLHEPDIKEHHVRYIDESDWNAMLMALKDLEPEYYKAYENIFSGPYLYNYNILITKAQVLDDYCNWLFPILERTEHLTCPNGSKRSDRYIGYLGENLLTLYFMYNKHELNIAHTGCHMLV